MMEDMPAATAAATVADGSAAAGWAAAADWAPAFSARSAPPLSPTSRYQVGENTNADTPRCCATPRCFSLQT